MSGAGDTTIQNLLNQAAEGDHLAYDEVIRLSAHRLQILASRMLKNYPRLRRWEETGDIFQAVAIRLHRSLKSVKPDSVKDFFGLAATQIRRTLIDLARQYYGPLGQAARHHTDPAISGHGKIVERQSSSVDEPETLESWTTFHAAVNNLPENEREVFGLVWYQGLPQAEIAILLGISIPTVKRRLRSARLLLANHTVTFESGGRNVE
jgi:RNA polymerase sigma-70 factor (ECF subfamily)